MFASSVQSESSSNGARQFDDDNPQQAADTGEQATSERGFSDADDLSSGLSSQWNRLGHSFRTAIPLARIQVVTDRVFWVYKEAQYQTLGSGGSLSPWDGFFSAPLARVGIG